MPTMRMSPVLWMGAILVFVVVLLASILFGLSNGVESAVAPDQVLPPSLTDISVTIGDSTWAEDGWCSLREAIASANHDSQVFNGSGECSAGNPGADTILLTLDVTLTITDNNADENGGNGLPVITSTITISGAGHTLARDEGSPPFRFFYLLNQNSSDLTLNDITVSNGGYTDTFDGGALYIPWGNNAKVMIEDSTFSDNQARFGGAIATSGYPTFRVNNSRFLANYSTDGGGAITYHCCSGLKTIINSLFDGNSTGVSGGAIGVNAGNRIVNSTFINNHADDKGGAVSYPPDRPASLYNVTIVGNTASEGGGLYTQDNLGIARKLYNSIISGNRASSSGDNCARSNGLIGVEAKNNLFGTNGDPGGCIGFDPSSTGNITATGSLGTIVEVDGDGKAVLADNGGGTETIALIQNSPAVDAGDDSLLPNESSLGIDGDGDGIVDDPIDYDQRTEPRPSQLSTDIGAYELGHVNLSGDDAQSALVNDTVTYTVGITNTGFTSDTFNLALSDSQWSSNLSQNSVTLAAGISTTFEVTVSIPAGAAHGETDIVIVTATSQGYSNQMDTAVLTTTALWNPLDLFAVDLSGDDYQSALVGEIVTYTMVVTNSGFVSDTINLDISGNTWPSYISKSSVVLAAGITDTFQVSVTIPIEAAYLEQDIVTITAVSQGNNIISDTANLTTTALWHSSDIYEIDLSGDDGQSALIGETVTYTMMITNAGVTTDTIDLALSGGTWPASLSRSTFELAAGISAAFQVTVTIPIDAAYLEQDQVTVTAVSQGDSSQNDSANLTSIALWDNFDLFLPLVLNGDSGAQP